MNRQELKNFYRLAAFWAASLLASATVVALTPPGMNPYPFIAGYWVGVAAFFFFAVYAIDWNDWGDGKERDND